MSAISKISIVFSFLLRGCTSTKLLSKCQTGHCTIKFFIEREKKSPESVDKIYAWVDSAGTISYVSFYRDRIIKVNSRDNLVFTAVMKSNSAVWGVLPLSKLDSTIMNVAAQHQDALHLQWLRPDSVMGYRSEVNYYHGQPKNYTLKPL